MKQRVTILVLFIFFLCSCQTEKSVLKEQRVIQVEIDEVITQLPQEEYGEEGETAPQEQGQITEPPLEPIDEEREAESIIEVIQSLEKSYEKRDFKMWQTFLTDNYKNRYNDSKYLKEEGWNAEDLESFFELLIEARESADISTLTISRVEFINPNKALVYVMLRDKEFPEPQHTFIKINDRWYKGLLEEGE